MRQPDWTLGAFGIIRNADGHVLLSHRTDRDLWNLPGGAVEPGELPTEAVVREIEEETGLHAEVLRLVGVYGKPGEQDLVFAFACRIIRGEPATTNEADAHRYFDPACLPANFPPRQAERIADAVKSSAPVIRWHRAQGWSATAG